VPLILTCPKLICAIKMDSTNRIPRIVVSFVILSMLKYYPELETKAPLLLVVNNSGSMGELLW